MSIFERFIPQGWQCPVCGRVYAPDFPYCVVCGNEQTITTAETTVSTGPQKTVEEYKRMMDDLLKKAQPPEEV